MKPCNQCGKCCVKYSNGDINASEQDLEMWRYFKPEIAEYVKGGLIWFSPSTGKPLSLCPFLREEKQADLSPSIYTCDIYFDRPEDCRLYPVTLQQMENDNCEMLEADDLRNPAAAKRALDKFHAQ